MLCIVTGLPFSGKSTLAKILAEYLDAEILNTDELRASVSPGVPKADFLEDELVQVYNLIPGKVKAVLQRGKSAIVDGSFRKAAQRESVHSVAQSLGVPTIVFHVITSEDQIESRVATRSQEGGRSATMETYKKVKTEYEKPDGAIVVQNDRSIDDLRSYAMQYLNRVYKDASPTYDRVLQFLSIQEGLLQSYRMIFIAAASVFLAVGAALLAVPHTSPVLVLPVIVLGGVILIFWHIAENRAGNAVWFVQSEILKLERGETVDPMLYTRLRDSFIGKSRVEENNHLVQDRQKLRAEENTLRPFLSRRLKIIFLLAWFYLLVVAFIELFVSWWNWLARAMFA